MLWISLKARHSKKDKLEMNELNAVDITQRDFGALTFSKTCRL